MEYFVVDKEMEKLLRFLVRMDGRKTSGVFRIDGDWFMAFPSDFMWLFAGKMRKKYYPTAFTFDNLKNIFEGAKIYSVGDYTFIDNMFGVTKKRMPKIKPSVDLDEYFDVPLKYYLSRKIKKLIHVKSVYGTGILDVTTVSVMRVGYDEKENRVIYRLDVIDGEDVVTIDLTKFTDLKTIVELKRTGKNYLFMTLTWMLKRYFKVIGAFDVSGVRIGFYDTGGMGSVVIDGVEYNVVDAMVGEFVTGRVVFAGAKPNAGVVGLLGGK